MPGALVARFLRGKAAGRLANVGVGASSKISNRANWDVIDRMAKAERNLGMVPAARHAIEPPSMRQYDLMRQLSRGEETLAHSPSSLGRAAALSKRVAAPEQAGDVHRFYRWEGAHDPDLIDPYLAEGGLSSQVGTYFSDDLRAMTQYARSDRDLLYVDVKYSEMFERGIQPSSDLSLPPDIAAKKQPYYATGADVQRKSSRPSGKSAARLQAERIHELPTSDIRSFSRGVRLG